MADTVSSLAARMHDLLVTLLTEGPGAVGDAGLHDIVTRAAALGPDGAWLAAGGHASLGELACLRGQTDLAVLHFDAAVAAGYNDCVALHVDPLRPLHADPRFRALYQRMRITAADLDELFWLHQEMRRMAQDAQDAAVDNIGRLDRGVSLLPQAPLPTREPHTPGVLMTRIDLAAVQTALRRAAVKLDFERSAGNTSLELIDGSWDDVRALRDARDADAWESRRRRAAEDRAFVERPGAGAALVPCPPLGSIAYPG
ncbi:MULTISPECIES: hypothetical protein [unclassified Streptomyces]|uniref:hypothetical protein n=1 Tax=unclassified Streptomyces TaxID=2593676 RepID=UPI0006F4B2CA|nr:MULTISPECIES: hypothetical protein [unclassified Streptomyces]KQX49714.1 hypothetical protein ASD33_13625 [Streptomyces sp. Root1304]KRA80242.1 hypothetical protein ASE09_19285 [Streptomyces sp. Root66D1]